jgi:predicted TIM-barrel fold metal-dependent hydrolase
MSIQMIDGQMHIWLPNSPERPWSPAAKFIHGDAYSAETALAQMDASGVQGAVLVPPSLYGADNSYSLEAAAAYPDRFVVVGRFDHEAADAADQLAHWLDQPGMVGMRVTMHIEEMRPLFVDPAFHWFWEASEATDLPLMTYVPESIDVLIPILERHPRLRLVIDHAGRYTRGPKDEAAWADLDQLLALARYPQVAVKMTSLPCFTTQPFPFPNLHRPIRAIHDAFGVQRMIWGADISRLTCSYDENIRLFSEALDFLTEDDKRWIFERTVSQWFRFAL